MVHSCDRSENLELITISFLSMPIFNVSYMHTCLHTTLMQKGNHCMNSTGDPEVLVCD